MKKIKDCVITFFHKKELETENDFFCFFKKIYGTFTVFITLFIFICFLISSFLFSFNNLVYSLFYFAYFCFILDRFFLFLVAKKSIFFRNEDIEDKNTLKRNLYYFKFFSEKEKHIYSLFLLNAYNFDKNIIEDYFSTNEIKYYAECKQYKRLHIFIQTFRNENIIIKRDTVSLISDVDAYKLLLKEKKTLIMKEKILLSKIYGNKEHCKINFNSEKIGKLESEYKKVKIENT